MIPIGAVSVTGGSGSNYVIGDGKARYMVLGAEDDTLIGGVGADTIGGADGDVLFGDKGNDRVWGDKGSDWLAGDAGSDSLSGGDGFDRFYFAGPGLGGDAITDFAAGSDLIVVDGTTFGLAAGPLDSRCFALSGQETADTRFVVDAATNLLSYDPDGPGALVAMPVAGFTNRAQLSAGDIYVVVS